jgi:microcystin-dependent protein
MTFSSPQAASQASGGNTAMQWMQAFLGMNYIIKLT